MKSIADLVDNETLHKLATPSNFRLGEAIVAQGGVELVSIGPLKVVAKVSGGQRRTVEFESTAQGLIWKCTRTARNGLFCKHCVAVGIVTSKQ